MKTKRKGMVLSLIATMLLTILSWNGQEQYKAARSYENAYEFFQSTGLTNNKHIEVKDGIIYFATMAQYFGGYSNTRDAMKYYNTVGYDVTLSGNGKSVTFSVKRGGTLSEIDDRVVNGYEYILYHIPRQTILDYAAIADPANAPVVLSAEKMEVRMDAIITVRQNQVQGSVEENGKGGLIENNVNGTRPIYHLLNPSHLAEAKNVFYGTTFETYTKITTWFDNYKLGIMYNIGEGAAVNVSGYKSGTYSGVSNMLYQNGSVVRKEYTLMQNATLLNTGSSGINLTKTGYHLLSESAWKKSDGTAFSTGKEYEPLKILPEVSSGSKTVVLYANWKPNTYTVVYNGNGGSGAMTPSSMTYDDTNGRLRVNGFYRPGYTFLGWSTNSSATTAQYSDQQGGALNLTSTNKGTVTLYAVWKPCVYQLTTEKGEGTGGTDTFYEKYENGFYSDKACGNGITKITVPALRGHTFTGYFNNMMGTMLVVDANGNIKVKNDFFKENAMLYAIYEANKYQVTYDMQGGKNGSTSKEATFNQLFPIAKAPTKDGASFQGYYTKPNGQGERIYNKFMATDTYYTDDHDVTVYAHWTDDVPPTLTFTANYDSWTNKQIVLTAEAEDAGSGLKKVCIYLVKADGSESLVAQKNGTGETELNTTFTNETVGITRYRAITEDMNGNTAESYCVAYYDIIAPTGVVVESDDSFGQFKLELDITDIDIGD